MKRFYFWVAAVFVAFYASASIADITVLDGTGASKVIKNFVCETTKLCNATVLIKSDGTEIGTSSAEVFVGGRGSAGTAAGGVLTVQGVASMTPLFMQSATAPVSTMNSASASSGVNSATACVYDDTSPTSLTENNFGVWRCSAKREGFMVLRDAAGNERGANVNASNQLSVSLDGQTGIFNSNGQATSANSSPVVIASDQSAVSVGGGVAHDGADSGNPVKIGGRARSSEITAVANNDRSDFITDLVGKLIVMPYANPENFVSGVISSAMTSTTSTSLVAAAGSGLRNYITACTFSNSHATVGTDILIQDGSGGTTLWIVPAAAVYGGAHITFPTPLRQPTTNTAIYVANVTTGASTKASCSGYKGA